MVQIVANLKKFQIKLQHLLKLLQQIIHIIDTSESLLVLIDLIFQKSIFTSAKINQKSVF